MTEDRFFGIAFGMSMGVHLILLAGQVVPLQRLRPQSRTPLEVVYETVETARVLADLQERLARAASATAGESSVTIGGIQPTIRVADAQPLRLDRLSSELTGGVAARVDLTDVVAAAQGNPVLLTYFTAIREQIQRAANTGSWVTTELREGMVYVSFILRPDGQAQQAAVVRDTSVASPGLWELAVRIVEAAAPFPPFPPSLGTAQKTIIVPLEFLLTP